MSNTEERLLQWLRDAHAMEKQAEQMLSGLAGRIKSYPQLKQKIESHERLTRDQAQRIKGCIERLGGDTSVLKDAAAKFLAMGQGFSGLFRWRRSHQRFAGQLYLRANGNRLL